MKYHNTLTISMFCALSICALSAAMPQAQATNYGQYHNQNITLTPSDGYAYFSYNIPDPDQFQHHGAIEWTSGTGSTTVKGNIVIDAGKDLPNKMTDRDYNYGLFIDRYASNCHITLKTQGANDAILIQTYGLGAEGVFNYSESSSITLDASRSTNQNVTIRTLNTSTEQGWGAFAIYSAGGDINVIGNLTASTYASNVIYCQSGTVTVTGRSTLSTSASGPANITGVGRGIYTTGANSSVILMDKTNISVYHEAIAAHNDSAIYLSGSTNMETMAEDQTVILASRNSIVTDYNSDGNPNTPDYHEYIINGNIKAGESSTDNAIVDLHMNSNSKFKGVTMRHNGIGGIINLALKDNANWTLTGDATMSNLTVFEDASLSFTIGGHTGDNNYTDITTDSVTIEEDSIIYVALNGAIPEAGDEYQLIRATTYNIADPSKIIFNFSKAQLRYDLAWDTSTFHIDGTIRVKKIPEPSTALLSLLGLGTLLTRRNKRGTHQF